MRALGQMLSTGGGFMFGFGWYQQNANVVAVGAIVAVVGLVLSLMVMERGQ